MLIAAGLLAEIVDHARRDAPNECCGLVAARDGRAVDVHPLENVEASPMRFKVDDRALMRLMHELDDAGLEIGAIYHSHTRSEPYPSQTDLNYAPQWPGVEWLIVGLAGGEPEVRSYRIDDGEVVEQELSVDGA